MGRLSLLALALLLACSPKNGSSAMPWEGRLAGDNAVTDVVVGEPLPLWSEGCFDIHHINSARGECSFLIFPDGTTMVVDVGEFVEYKSASYDKVTPRPSQEVRPVEVYSRYIRHFLPKGSSRLDYCMLSHYHMDHMGRVESQFGRNEDGGYVLSGVTALYDAVPFAKVIDRSYPVYDKEALLTPDQADMIPSYAAFVDYRGKNGGLVAEQCAVGSTTQIVQKHNAGAWRSFKAQNWAASGYYWNGTEAVNANKSGSFRENAMSCATLFSYGKFDYWTSGDGTTCDVAASEFIPQRVEAMKANHHMSAGTMDATQLGRFRPKVVATQSFYVRDVQPNQAIMHRLLDNPGGPALFFTNIEQVTRDTDPSLYAKAAAIGGHIVIRVQPGGDVSWVYVLDDTNFEYRVKSIHGPYTCE